MKITSLHGQMTFDEMKGSLERLPKTNRWVRMGDTLPWTEYEKVYNKRLRNETVGASNRPGRMVIGALIIKHKLGLSDEETILAIQENPYMQYMCGLTEYSDQPIFNPSLFTTIRKRITIEDINSLTLELAKKSQEKKAKEHEDFDRDKDNDGGIPSSDRTQPTDLKADATCADAEVRYPTDIDLIEDGSKYIDRMIDKVCGIKKIRKAAVERQRIRTIYLNVIKRRHKGAKLIKDAITRMLPLLYRDILTLLNLIGVDDETYGRFNSTQKRTIQAVIDIRDNRKTLKEKGIEIMGRPLGRPPKNPTAEQLERERIGVSLRNEAEAQFGTGKRAYRANNIRARLPQTAECWTAMCYFVRNLAKFMRELCRVLIEIWALIRHFGSSFINPSAKTVYCLAWNSSFIRVER